MQSLSLVRRLAKPNSQAAADAMQKYRVMIHGENLLTEVAGIRQKLGFFTNVYVEAFTAADAELRAIEIVREDTSLAGILLNLDHDPLRLSVQEVHEMESFDGHRLPRDAFMLYPPTNDENDAA